jgi:glycosyltransferase involved in cell wall biosynthesis
MAMKAKATPLQNEVVLVGNPFFPTGRGGTVLSFFRSFRAVSMPVKLCNAYSRSSYGNTNPALDDELRDSLLSRPGDRINIYHLNADELDFAQTSLKHKLPDGAYNIIYPFWELSNYPQPWQEKLDLFDEIWAPSVFIQQMLEKTFAKPIYHMPLPVQVEMTSFLGRQHFGLPEGSYLFLFSFDFRSYLDRKNPDALLNVFEMVRKALPGADIRIVIKVHGTDVSAKTKSDYKNFVENIRQSGFRNQIILIDQVYNDNEIKNLIRCCDCFVSLHRSEGFGLGMAEAMYLGKPVIATGYSGNLDFMTKDNSCLVDYELIPVKKGQYPFAEGQVWADPDVEQAYFMRKLLDDRDYGRVLGLRASQSIRKYFSYLALGLRYQGRLIDVPLMKSASTV